MHVKKANGENTQTRWMQLTEGESLVVTDNPVLLCDGN
jgi:hypothetical protein